MTIPILWTGPQCVPLVETIAPSGDFETSGWTTTPLWSKLNVLTDVDTVQSTASASVCPTQDTHNFTVHMENPVGTPDSSACQVMRVSVRARKVVLGGSGQVDLTVRVLEGTTVRATFGSNNIGTTMTTRTYTLSTAQVDSIGNHNDLRIQVEVDECGDLDFDSVRGQCAWTTIDYS